MFENFTKWLNGTFICVVCNQSFHTVTFGYGQCICPGCYTGEGFIFLDRSYWLNRLLMRIVLNGGT